MPDSLPDRLAASWRSRPKRSAAAYVLAIATASLSLTTLLHFPYGPEHWSADLRTAYLSQRPATQHNHVALVYVTDKTLAGYPYVSPTDRQLLADLVRAIDAAGPKVVGFDFIIDRPTEPAKDDALIEAIKTARAPIVLGAVDEDPPPGGGKTYQARYLERTGRDFGHLYFDERRSTLVISDHVVRLMARRPPGTPMSKSFAERVAEKDGPFEPPLSSYISWLLTPKDRTETFLTLSAEQVLGRGETRLPVQDLLRGKLVLIGGDFPDRDRHLTPLSVLSDTRYPGLFIHAQILAQLIEDRSLAMLPWYLRLAAIVLAGCLGYVIGRRVKQYHLIIELIAVAALIAGGIVAFAYAQLILPYTGVLLALLAGIAGGRYGRRVLE